MGKVSLRPIITCIFLAVLFYTARCTNPELASVKEEWKENSELQNWEKGQDPPEFKGQDQKEA